MEGSRRRCSQSQVHNTSIVMASTRARKCHTRTCIQMMSIESKTDEDSRMHASRRERIRKCSAIVVLGSEDSMSDKERCVYDTQHREHKWQKIVKPVFFKQFSTIFERALAPEETSDERETMHATAQSKPSFWPPNTGAKRPPIFFSLLTSRRFVVFFFLLGTGCFSYPIVATKI